MKKYDEYKDSGVAWIGEVPKHWEVRKIKTLSSVKRGASPRPIDDPKYFAEDGEFSWVRIADVSVSDKYLTSTTQKLSELGSSLSVKRFPGDIFISIAGTVGKPIISSIKCCIHDGFVYFPYLKNINTEFLYYIFMSGQPYLGLGKMGTQLNLNTETIGNIDIPYPPITVQTAIATYLDTHCAKIDNLISIQQKRIALLQELKQSVITHAVTKGLNPNVEMKQSGVEWIGDVPKHWEVMPLKKYCKMNKGLTFTKADIVDEGESVISYGQIHSKLNNGVSLDCKLIRHVPIGIVKNGEKSKAHKGDFIFADTSEDYEGCGNFVYNDTNQAIYGGYHTIILQTDTLNAKYIGYLFKTDCWRYQIRSRVYGVKVYSITQSILSICSIILPPQDEQKQIASYLDHKCATIDTSISNAQHQIELLQEYKQSLITEVVTGKRKVTDN